MNLYGMVANDAINAYDILGLEVGDAKHPKGKCSSSMSCRQNLAQMLRFQLEIAQRYANDFTDTFRQWAAQGKEIPPTERYNPNVTNYRDSWNNHRKALETAIGHFGECVAIVAAQFRSGQCGCCRWLDDKRLRWLDQELERDRKNIPEEIRRIVVRPIVIPPSVPVGAPVLNPDGRIGVMPDHGYGNPGPEAVWLGAGIAALGIALCDGPEPGPADAAAFEFFRRVGIGLAK